MSITERREREKIHRRTAILESAERLFYEKGFEKTRMVEIAEDCELSKGTLYLYFRNKEDLARGVVIHAYDILIDLLSGATTGIERGLEQIREMLAAFVRFYHDCYPHLYLTLILESYLQDQLVEGESWSEFFERIHQIRALMIAALEQGIHDGSIRSDINPETAAMTYMNAVHGFFYRIVLYGASMERHMIQTEVLVGELNSILINSLT